MAVSYYLAPIRPDDPVLDLFRAVAAEARAVPDDEEDDPIWKALESSLVEHPESIDLWRQFDQVDSALGRLAPDNFCWTAGAEQMVLDGSTIIHYLPPDAVRRVDEQLAAVDAAAMETNLDAAVREGLEQIERAWSATSWRPPARPGRSAPDLASVVSGVRRREDSERSQILDRAGEVKELFRGAAERRSGILSWFSG